MADLLKPLSLAALVALAAPAFAQDTGADTAADTASDAAPAEAPVTPGGTALDMGEDATQPAAAPETYSEAYGDWSRECIRQPEGQDGPDPCQLSQLLYQPGEGNTIGKISVGRLPEGGQAVAGSMVIMPLGTLLTEQLVMSVDGAAQRRYPFRFCDSVGCVAQIGFTAAEIEAFKAGNEATITIAGAGTPNEKVAVPVSLKGFTAAWESLFTE